MFRDFEGDLFILQDEMASSPKMMSNTGQPATSSSVRWMLSSDQMQESFSWWMILPVVVGLCELSMWYRMTEKR